MSQNLNKIFRLDIAGKQIISTATINEAIRIMATTRMNCLLVRAPGGKAVGILSEHDIVTAFARLGEKARGTKVTEFMTLDVVAISENETIDAALKMMAENNVRHLPVLSGEGVVIDFLSVMDLVIKKATMPSD